MIRRREDAVVVLAAPALDAYRRSRLVACGLAFVVPGNQLYVPELAMNLRERFRAPKPVRGGGLSPAAQAVLLYRLLRPGEWVTTASRLAKPLHYSAMSVGRAFDELVDFDLARVEKSGRERHILFQGRGRELFDAARDVLRSPVRAEKFVRGGRIKTALQHAGESALADQTGLPWPQVEVCAVAAKDWKRISESCGFMETDRHEAEMVVETWFYDPAGLAVGPAVDPLSLYVQFHAHENRRIAAAAERLLEKVAW